MENYVYNNFKRGCQIITIIFGFSYGLFFWYLIWENIQTMYHGGMICGLIGLLYLFLFAILILALFASYNRPTLTSFYKYYVSLLIILIILIIIATIFFVENLTFYIEHEGKMNFHSGPDGTELRYDDTMPITIGLYITSIGLYISMIFFNILFIREWKKILDKSKSSNLMISNHRQLGSNKQQKV